MISFACYRPVELHQGPVASVHRLPVSYTDQRRLYHVAHSQR